MYELYRNVAWKAVVVCIAFRGVRNCVVFSPAISHCDADTLAQTVLGLVYLTDKMSTRASRYPLRSKDTCPR